jgi:hypothetical protein
VIVTAVLIDVASALRLNALFQIQAWLPIAFRGQAQFLLGCVAFLFHALTFCDVPDRGYHQLFAFCARNRNRGMARQFYNFMI